MSDIDFESTDRNEESEDPIPVTDKRKFNTDGERVAGGDSPDDMISPLVTKLEDEINIERMRREAAEQKLVGVQKKFDELRAEMEKETAEMRQRLQRNNEQRMQLEKSDFITALLPILDNINLAVSAAEKEGGNENLLDGFKGVARLFEQTLISNGVEPIAAVGLEFNPELHEAVEMVEAGEDMDWKIVGEFTKGYKFGERLLRPARVQVGRWLPPGTDS
jgi:molecular chaperone GrpE